MNIYSRASGPGTLRENEIALACGKTISQTILEKL